MQPIAQAHGAIDDARTGIGFSHDGHGVAGRLRPDAGGGGERKEDEGAA